MTDLIGYDKIVETAMRQIVYKALNKVKNEGLLGGHYFVISFLTKATGVDVAKDLLDKFPGEMTIIIQYQFKDLVVDEDAFEVSLSFSGVYQKLRVPYNAITAFSDPHVNFGLKFSRQFLDDASMTEEELIEVLEDGVGVEDTGIASQKDVVKKKTSKKKGDGDSNVISLDAFRKKDQD